MIGARGVLLRFSLALAAGTLLLGPAAAGAAGWRYGDAWSGADAPPAGSTPDRADAASGMSTDAGAAEPAVPGSDDDRSDLSRAEAFAEQDQPVKALEHCLKAEDTKPQDVEIVRRCARYAEWAGDLPESRGQFEHLLDLAPDDREGLLGAARAHGWSGNLENAAGYYKRYLGLYPDDQDAWIEYAQVRSWQGDFAAALEALEAYRDRFGETSRYLEEKARYLAWDDRPRHALEINTPLLEEKPDDYERAYTQAVALAADHRSGEALQEVEILKRLRPDSGDMLLLERLVRTPGRSSVTAGVHYSDDSDTIQTHGIRLEAEFHLTPDASLSTGASRDTVRADAGSAFETADGRERIRHEHAWVGGSYRFNPLAAVSGRVGRGDIQGGGEFTPYDLSLQLRPADELALAFSRSRELHALSPRAVSLEIERTRNELSVNWRPDHRYVVEAVAGHDDLSDGNASTQLVLAPRRAVLRTGRFNADLGLYLDWWSFDDNLDNGYYDPERYQRYAGSLFGYWKLGEDDGLSLVGTAGFDKDEQMDHYELGTDVVAELTWGLYRDWMSVVRLDYSDRFRSAGGYDGWNINFSLTRRF